MDSTGMFKILKLGRMLLGVGTVTGVTTFYYCNLEENKALAYWPMDSSPFHYTWDNNWDHRQPQYLSNRKSRKSKKEVNNGNDWDKYTPKATRHLILIRHGQYNLEGKNDTERHLTELGCRQAEYTANRLKELALPYTDITVSTMNRARQTAAIILKHLPDVPATKCDLIREGGPIRPDPPSSSDKGDNHYFQDGPRIEAAFRKYFHRADPDQQKDSFHIIVCHANVIRYFICRALQFPSEGWLRLVLNHAGISWISITPSGRCILRTMTDTGFMPAHEVTVV